jgi:hypothetical protein
MPTSARPCSATSSARTPRRPWGGEPTSGSFAPWRTDFSTGHPNRSLFRESAGPALDASKACPMLSFSVRGSDPALSGLLTPGRRSRGSWALPGADSQIHAARGSTRNASSLFSLSRRHRWPGKWIGANSTNSRAQPGADCCSSCTTDGVSSIGRPPCRGEGWGGAYPSGARKPASRQNSLCPITRQEICETRTKGSLEGLRVINPPADMQQRFGIRCDEALKVLRKQHGSDESLSNLFYSLLQRAFRGEL